MIKKRIIVEGYFGLNEQDPGEPTGIIFSEDNNNAPQLNDHTYRRCLDEVLSKEFGMKPRCDWNVDSPKMRMTIEEI